MTKLSWEVVEGLGAQDLNVISEGVQTWNRLRPDFETLQSSYVAVNDRVEGTTSDITNQWKAGKRASDPVSLMSGLSEAATTDFAKAALLGKALEELEEVEAGVSFNRRNSRARLHVIGEGLLRSTGIVEPGHSIDFRGNFAAVAIGTVLEGKIWSFSSKPKIGGLMRLDHKVLTSYLQGFVDPATGTPRVELDILEKTNRSARS